MTDRAQEFFNAVWDARNNQGADTEEKLVSAILQIVAENIQFFQAQDGRIVLDKNDMLQLVEELTQLTSFIFIRQKTLESIIPFSYLQLNQRLISGLCYKSQFLGTIMRDFHISKSYQAVMVFWIFSFGFIDLEWMYLF
jgi:hypothetical protein